MCVCVCVCVCVWVGVCRYQWTNDTILGLLYNSEYIFDIEYEKHSANVTLTTPGCSRLADDSFKLCSLIGPPLTGVCSSVHVCFSHSLTADTDLLSE